MGNSEQKEELNNWNMGKTATRFTLVLSVVKQTNKRLLSIFEHYHWNDLDLTTFCSFETHPELDTQGRK